MTDSRISRESVLTFHDETSADDSRRSREGALASHDGTSADWRLPYGYEATGLEAPRIARGQLRLPDVRWDSYGKELPVVFDDGLRGGYGQDSSNRAAAMMFENAMIGANAGPMVGAEARLVSNDARNSAPVDRNAASAPLNSRQSSGVQTAMAAPKMYVCLFGGLRVYVGGEQVDEAIWTKNKTKVLFAHLLVRFGKDVGREILTELLWPESGEKRAVENLYVTWALLKKALNNDDVARPYVINRGTLYRINASLVESDVHEFDQLARKMLFEEVDKTTMRRLFMRMDELYTGDFMSGVRCDSYLERVRSRYRDTYVDVLVAAANLMLEIGNTGEALWFARKAFGIEVDREDVYQTMMRVQYRAGQRTSAMETYFMCQKHLDEQLGIPLSRKTIEIYEKMLNEEDVQ